MAGVGLQEVPTYEALLNDPAIDAVVLATPHSGHPREIAMAVEARRPVFCEKPLALTRADAARAVRACEAADLPLALGHNRRFLPAYTEMQRLIASGTLGTPLHVEGNFSGSFGLEYDSTVWRADRRETPAGGLTLMGIHVLDAMIGLLGPIEAVAAMSLRQVLKIELDDTSAGMLRFRRGQSGFLSTLTATARLWRLQVFGTKGWAHMLDHHILELGMIGAAVRWIEYPVVDIERLELEAFARSVSGGERYPVPLPEVVNGIGALEAFAVSAAGGGVWVRAD
jgi:predicted dehydrogenase